MKAQKYWRVPSGYRHEKGTTALDVINFESDYLGNSEVKAQTLCVVSEMRLEKASADQLQWACKRKVDAKRYGKPEPFNFIDPLVLANDGDGGVLLFFD